jgi:hypothetical protein
VEQPANDMAAIAAIDAPMISFFFIEMLLSCVVWSVDAEGAKEASVELWEGRRLAPMFLLLSDRGQGSKTCGWSSIDSG